MACWAEHRIVHGAAQVPPPINAPLCSSGPGAGSSGQQCAWLLAIYSSRLASSILTYAAANNLIIIIHTLHCKFVYIL